MKKNNILILTNFILTLISELILAYFDQKLIAITLFVIMTVITFNIEITKKNYIFVRFCYGMLIPIQILLGRYSGTFKLFENKYYILAYFILYIIGGGRIFYKERQLDIYDI